MKGLILCYKEHDINGIPSVGQGNPHMVKKENPARSSSLGKHKLLTTWCSEETRWMITIVSQGFNMKYYGVTLGLP